MRSDTALPTGATAAAQRSGLEYAGLALVALFLLVMVGIPIFAGLRNVWRAAASSGWPTTEGVVVDAVDVASTERDRDADGGVRETRMTNGRVTVQYRLGGRTYTTQTLHFGEWAASGDATWAQLRLLRHPVGARVRVSYAPRDPGLAVVHPGLTPLVLLLPGIGLGLLTVLLAARHARDRPGGSLLPLVAGVLGVAGLALLGVGVRRLWRAHASARWPSVPGVIVFGPGAADYVARRDAVPLVYRYAVDGHTYFNNVRAFGQLAAARATRGGGWVERVEARYPAGARVVVRHAPGHPELSVLEPGIAREAWLLPAAGAVLLLVALAASRAATGTTDT
ncbi:DUF3592 domain-containing protein [Gemmatirosa kalamazoonensis]|nr:DUF3592 domain-containing protein [Gemmatirosa kalamazoonensis]